MKKIFVTIVAICVAFASWAEGTQQDCPLSGTCGVDGSENITWQLDCDGLLIISGIGAMADYGDVNAGGNTGPGDGSGSMSDPTPAPGRANGLRRANGDNVAPWGTAITVVRVEEGITHIGANAFNSCSSLLYASLPSTLQSIGDAAFLSCSGLDSVRCLATVPPTLGSDVFMAANTSALLFVPSSSVTAYQSTNGWSSFTNVQGIEGNTNPTGVMRLYCRVTQEWWTTEGAAVGVYLFADENTHNAAWPGERMTPVEGQDGLWFVDTDPTVYTSVIFTRVNGSGDIADWGAKTADLALPTDSNNLYTITSTEAVWGDPGVTGEWTRYDNNAGGGGETISSYTLVGDSALCGGKAWDVTNTEADLIPQGDYNYVYTIGSVHLTAYKNYEYKIVANHSWDVSQYPVDGNYTFHVTQSGYYSVQFTFNVDGGAAATPTLLTADEGSQTSEKYSNYALLINEERMVTFAYAGVNDANWAQYVAHVQLSAGESFRIINRVGSDYQIAPTLEEYGEYTNFTSGSDGYYTCYYDGCYDVFYKMNNTLYIGGGGEACSAGVPYDGTSMATATVNITVTNESGNWQGSVAINGEKGGDNGRSGTYLLGSTITVEAFPGTMFQFLRWSDGVLYNPREIVVTGDMTIHADMGETLNYMYGVLINNSLFVRSTWQENGENTVRAQVEQGDTIQLMFTGYAYGLQRRIWMYDLDPYTESGLFTGGAETGYLVCQRSGCYDIYIKENNENNSVFIAQGTVCSRGQNVDEIALSTLPGYYIHGNDSIFGAWDYNKGVYMESYNMQFWLDAGIHEIYVSKVSYGSEAATISSSCSSTSLFTMNNHKTFYMSQPGNLYVSISDGSVCLNGDFSWVYSLVGDSVLFGSAWNLNDFSTEMTWVGENMCNYSLDSVALEAGDYEYKVISNHVWEAGSYPADGNYTIHIETSGVYQILFDFIPGSSCSATPNYIHAIQGDQPCGIVASGECGADGANVTWLLTCDSILTIGGDGRMADYNEETTIAPWYQYREAYNSVYIAAGVLNVGDLAFRQSPNLRYVDLASTVVSLGNYSFYDCPNLHTLTLPESVTTLSDNTPFGGTTTMTNPVYNSNVFVRLPEDYAGEYTVAEGTTVIASQAFKGCNQLTSLVLPNTVHVLSGSSIFENCTMLVSVNIPEGVTALGEFTFSNCSSLKAIDLPSTLASLGSYCFGECWMIESITCRATTPPEANGSALSGVNYMIPIYVPAGTAEIYKAADGWSGFTDYRDIIDGCVIASGECGAEGNNLMWILYCDSVLTIRGTGAMENYSVNSNGQAPWAEYGLDIRDILIEEGVTSIGSYAFYNAGSYTNGAYNNVRSVSIPSTVSKLENNYFYQCPIETVSINSDTIVGHTSYSSGGSLHKIFGAQVREYYIGNDVRSIANFAFYNQSADSVRSIILPDSLQTIGQGAFEYLENLEIIIFPQNLQSIGQSAFYGSGLKSVEIPASIESISSSAFESCAQLTDLTFHNGLKEIGVSAFSKCTALQHITLPETVEKVSSGAFTQNPNLTMLTILSDTLVRAGQSGSLITKQLYGNYIREIMLGDSITSIGRYAFSSLDSLRSVTFPSNLTSIGQYAFQNCKMLESIDLPNTVTLIDNCAFQNCYALSHVSLGTGVQSINTYAFDNCSALTEITFPASLTSVGQQAFYGTGLRELHISEHVTSLGSRPFDGCTNLTKVTVNSDAIINMEYKPGSSTGLKFTFGQYVREYILGDSVKGIGDCAFYNCDSLRSITFPDSLRTIGKSAFCNCKNLPSVVIPDNITELPNSVFQYCSALTDVTLNSKLEIIDTYAFNKCTSLLEITIPASVQSISSGAFTESPKLTKVTIHSNAVTAPDQQAGSSGSGLKARFGGYVREYILGSEITAIGNYQFSSCDSLTTIGWSENLQTIGNSAFVSAKGLKTLLLPNSVTSIGTSAFNACTGLDSISLGEGLIRIGNSAFYGCTGLKQLILPEGLKAINTSAFYQCTGLTEVTIPASVDSVGTGIFAGCPDLTITINSDSLCRRTHTYSSNLDDAFGGANNSQIKRYIIGEGVTTLGTYAFYSAPLTSVVLPSTLTSIAANAFGSCSSLTSVTCDAYTPPTIASNSFSKQDTLFVRCETRTAYQAADYWKNFGTIKCSDGGDELDEVSFDLTHAWTFIMLPSAFGMEAADIVVDGEVEWGTYNGEKRASGRSGWENRSVSDVYMSSQALIVRAAGTSAKLTISVPEQAQAMSTVSVPVTLHPASLQQNANWCFVGNPYPYGYLLSGLAAQGIESPIHVWNGTGYSTYTPGIDDYIIPPFGAFFIQLPEPSEGEPLITTIHFDKEYLRESKTHEFIDGELHGEFSVSASRKVHFSQGSLKFYESYYDDYTFDLVGRNVWLFEDKQYYRGYMYTPQSLFCWGTGDNPTKTTNNTADYTTFVDWGVNPIYNGGNIANAWRTLSGEEWLYLIEKRRNASALFGVAVVNNVNGLIILPDDFNNTTGIPFVSGVAGISEGDQPSEEDYALNTFSLEQWNVLEANGAVFLPTMGYASSQEGFAEIRRDFYGVYWASSNNGESISRTLFFSPEKITPNCSFTKLDACAVRLVRDVIQW